MNRTSVLGGDTRSRGLFTGRRSRPVMITRYAATAAVLVLLVFLQLWGLILGGVLLLVVFGATTDTSADSTVARWAADRRR